MQQFNALPGPRGLPLVGNAPQLQRNPLAFMRSTRAQYGHLVRLSLAGTPVVCAYAPEHVLYCLTEHPRDFTSLQSQQRSNMREVLGEGLLTTEGEIHRQQRRLVQPAFHRQRIDQYADVMVRYTEQMLETWQPGQELELASAMQHLTLRIIVHTLFSVEELSQANQLSEAFTAVIGRPPQGLGRPRVLSRFSAQTRDFNRGKKTLDDFVYGLIQQRRATGGDRGDILDMLLTAQEEGQGMSDSQVHDQVMTLVAAGHETTQNSLCWTFYLLAQHPEIRQKLLLELHTVLAGHAPTVADLARLPYLEWVMNESWRVLPPVWRMGRRAIRDFTLGDYHLPAGTIVLLSQWVTHNDAEIWHDPQEFRPERWDPIQGEKVPRGAYFPFGLGPRICIGMPFAQMETKLLLAAILQRYTPEPVPDHPIELLPRVTLRPKHGMRVTLNPTSIQEQMVNYRL
ncbi:cytochrome P450 [Ktedonobacter sp. SOSP1-85]|uniref:cytochrome P450 n=1 Tax=Ktedonobacter sp. SOSP1-85 TaxID=2778367 RepID=UPI0019167B24|nr:cytochrome P450 [Ktedonobacter sp. SOSP1-85]GHO81755.1 cytochrome P450 [Ktedonobacter sp. SOSP1-85]